MSARLRLRRADGAVIGGIFLHKMSAPDPGVDLHDHPWNFWSFILWGGYSEERADTRSAPLFARFAEQYPTSRCTRGVFTPRPWLSGKLFRLDECHSIKTLNRRTSWSLVIHGPNRRGWGFYLPTGYMPWAEYDRTVRAERRDMYADISSNNSKGSRI